MTRAQDFAGAGIEGVARIGDALAPGAIVHAVHSGHRHAREFQAILGEAPYTRDFPV
jgi:dimethylamine/trimethylamine dehydrogenase